MRVFQFMRASTSLMRIPGRFSAFLRDERGATAIEYGLICALMFLAIVTALFAYRDGMASMFARIGTAVTGATGG